jgi:L-cystine uptake protein TcyP (sodium:dicarboxylate symporter family)
MAPWLAAAGAFVVSLDSMMNIAFPAIAKAFAVPPETIQWVIICYTGVYAITAFVGRLAPYGVFAITASAAGTIDVSDLERLECSRWTIAGRVSRGHCCRS